MAGRIPIAFFSLIVVLSLLSCSGAPTDTAAIHSDTTEIRTEDTTEQVAELILKEATSSDQVLSEEKMSTDSLDAAVVEVPESTTHIDLESVEIVVDKFKNDEVATTTEMAEATVLADAPIALTKVQENPSVEKEEMQTEESPSTVLQDSPSLTAILMAKPVEISSPAEKIEVQLDDHTESVQASPVEDALTTDGPEVDSVMQVVLKVDLKNRTEEEDETTESVADAEDDGGHTESIAVVLKADEESTEATTAEPNELLKIDVTAVADDLEDGTERSIQSTDSVGDSTESSMSIAQADEVVLLEPQWVKIFDPSVDVEATTFLAEANRQSESDTTESPYRADEFVEKDGESLTTDESVMMTTELGTESGTESVTESGTETEVMSETTSALPVITKQSLPSPVNNAYSNKKRSYKGYKVYRVILPTEESVRRILSMEDEPGVEFWADPRLLLRPRGLFVTSAADVMVAPKIVPQMEAVFRQARLTYTVLIDDVHNSISKENPESSSSFARSQSNSDKHRLTWERYHRLADINSYLEYLKEAHPDWIEVVPIGKSSQGRPIQVIKLSRSRQPGTMEASQKKAILIDAGIHANEWITPAALTWMVNELVENADSYGCILERFDWYFVPMVNPDGYEYSHSVDRMWRKTRRNYTSNLVRSSARKLRVDSSSDEDEQCLGADINRNFEFHWRKGGSSSNVCSPAFAGIKPFSEPESRALANFMLKKRSKLAMYMSLHSYSQMWLLPWGFAETRPEDFSQLYSLAKIGARALQRVHNTSYLIGSVPDLLALASGTSQDWAKGVAGVRYSYTLEVRDAGERGMILPAQQIIPTAEETWAGIYAASVELAHRLYDHLPSCSPF